MIRISTKYFWLAFMFSFFKPWLLIDGQQHRLQWGDNAIPATPGVHHLTIWIPYLWKVGEATITVDNSYGEAQVFYASPPWAFGKGAIGTTAQDHPNKTLALIIGLGLPALILLCCCCGTIISAMNGSGSSY